MISALCPYIQLMAAIYFTMCIDSIIGRKFWSPAYYNAVKEKLVSSLVPNAYHKSILTNVKCAEQTEIKKSRKRGAFLLFVCVFSLILCGFEDCDIYQLNMLYISYVIMMILSIIVFGLGRWLLKHWWTVVLSCVVILVVQLITRYYFCPHFDIISSEILAKKMVIILKFMIAIFLVIPLAMQIAINWLFSFSYLDNIEMNLINCMSEFNDARNFNASTDKMTSLSPKYQNVVAEKIGNVKTQDQSMKDLAEILQKDIQEVTQIPSLSQLVLAFIKPRKRFIRPLKNNGDLSSMLEESIDFEDLFKQYKRCNPIPSIETFCNEHKIDVRAFNLYIKTRTKRRTNNKQSGG